MQHWVFSSICSKSHNILTIEWNSFCYRTFRFILRIYGINFCHVAARSENPAMLYFLLRYRPEMTQLLLDGSDNGFTPLHYAAQHDKFITVQYLILQFGLDPMVKDNKGNTPLHIAVSKNARKSVSTLLRFGPPAQIEAKNNNDGKSKIIFRTSHYLARFLESCNL